MPILRSKLLTQYFVLTYFVFLVLLGLTGFLISVNIPVPIQTIMKNLCAWAPTISLVLLYRKIYGELKIKEYLKNNFLSRINIKVILLITLFQTGIFLISIVFFTFKKHVPFSSISFNGLSTILLAFLINITSGPSGEELGWRGFALNELQKKLSPFRSAIIIGIIWGFWHTPLWFLSGYSGIELIKYIGLFLIGIVSLSIIITLFYNRQKNILIPVWIHFLFNFLLQITKIELLSIMIYYVACYVIFAAVLLWQERKNVFKIPI